ncbi:MAG: type II secretion system protein [Lachnospiraceae bacterium]|nr:type II secretion system protein [Lachnospiraceae bacterium]
MNNLKKKKRSGNEGFSLVEVLCAVVLLAIIAAPVLQMFYSSYAMNQRSKKYLAAADLAQAVMEGISAQTYEDSKTVEQTPQTITGLATYYQSSIIGPTQKPLYAVANGATANVPTGHFYQRTGGGAAPSGTDVILYIDKITYNGYHFNMTIKFQESGLYSGTTPTRKYISIPVEIAVYDADSSTAQFGSSNVGLFDKIEVVETRVPNKR